MLAVRAAHRPAGGGEHLAQHRGPAHGGLPREALELFGSAPVDLLALGPFAVYRVHAGGGAEARPAGGVQPGGGCGLTPR